MGPSETAVLIATILVVLGSAAYIVNHIEQQRIQKRQLINALKQEVRQAKHLVGHFPESLMTAELNRFLWQFIHLQLKKLCSVAPTEQNQTGLQMAEAQLQNTFQQHGFREGHLTVINNRSEAISSASIIRELAQWLKSKSHRQTTSSQTIRDLLNYCRYCYEQVAIDAMIFDAIDSESVRGSQVAYHQYKSCLIALSKLDRGILVDAQIHALKAHMQTIAPHEEDSEETENKEEEKVKSQE
jgi:hypothetical protein